MQQSSSTGFQVWLVRLLAIGLTVFQLFANGFGLIPSFQQRAIHVAFIIALGLAANPFRKGVGRRKTPIADLVLIGIAVVGCAHAFINYVRFVQDPTTSSVLDLVLGTAMVLLLLEVSRRAIGWVFPAMAAVLMAYTLWGDLIPGYWGFLGLSPKYIVQLLYQSAMGMWGFITGVMTDVVAIFMIFGSLLVITGGGETFVGIAGALMGKVRGGPALIAVVASTMFGTISGSAAANVVVTGTFTIPLMKSIGYKPEFAGAVEAAASNGGMIMPPVMGATAFIMAEWLGVPYVQIMIAAIVPAILYYWCIALQVRFTALKDNLQRVPEDRIPRLRDVLKPSRISHLIIPSAVLLILLFMGYTPGRVAFSAWAIGVALYLITGGFRWAEIKDRLKKIVKSFEDAAKGIMLISPLLVSANMVVALLNATGLSIKMNSLVASTFEVAPLLGLLTAALAAIVLGMGLPVIAAYVITVAMIGSAFQEVGITPLAAHMFLFYFSSMAAISPPVCPVSYVAAGIARANWVKLAFNAVMLSIVAYLVPFFFVGGTTLLLKGPLELIALDVFTAFVGAMFLAGAIVGFMTGKLNVLTRVILLASGALFMSTGTRTDLYAIAALVAAVLLNFNSIKDGLAARLKRQRAQG